MAPFGGVGYVSGKFWQFRQVLLRFGGVSPGSVWQLRRSGVRFSLGRFVKAVMVALVQVRPGGVCSGILRQLWHGRV